MSNPLQPAIDSNEYDARITLVTDATDLGATHAATEANPWPESAVLAELAASRTDWTDYERTALHGAYRCAFFLSKRVSE